MKKIIFSFAILLFLVSCGGNGTKNTENASSTDSKYTMVTIPKLRSAWFEDYESGSINAAKELGVETYMQAPSSADEAQQVRIIEDAVNQGVSAILVVPNNAASCVPAFNRAKENNIVVLTHESPDQEGADYDIEMIDNVKFGERFIEELVATVGDSGEYAIYVGSLTVPAHNIWADSAIAYAKEKYPNLVMVDDKFPVSEDRNAARQKTLELLTIYPNLKGILAFGSQGAPGAGQALREKSMEGKVAVFGTTTPKEVAPFLKDKSVTSSIIWSAGEASYAMVHIAKMILDGKGDEIKQGLEIPNLGVPSINGKNILFNRPLIITVENVDNYNF
ncbi:ABC transporter substrate-binding protein [Brachyspira hampsonii]|uniref:ABC transporter substrate-binding protein n=1 Tax=Brachyspira hampsonii TaxID=1287055 RepID=A0A1E5NHY0_9SPIR|nr:autoinducer 2 ABC transporter substrate-binding protein [Brachyspira hampsonii]OEJ15771.1 ABC transporter substrate-binding protein [Brachyspira hampsonii]